MYQRQDRKKFYEEEAANYKTPLCHSSSFQYFQTTKKLVFSLSFSLSLTHTHTLSLEMV